MYKGEKAMRNGIIVIIVSILLVAGYLVIFEQRETKHIEIMIFGEYKDKVKEIIAKYEEENKNIEIEVADADYFEFVSNITERYKKNEKIPDAFLIINDHLSPLVENNIIEKADPKIGENLLNEGNRAFSYNEKCYGYPLKGETIYLFYNTELIEETGVSLQEIIANAKTLEKKRGIKGLEFPANEFYYHFPWYTYYGGRLDELLQMERHTDKLINELKATKEFLEYSNYNSVMERFINKKSAMIFNGSWAFEHLEKANIQYDFKTIKDKEFKPFFGIKGFVVSKQSKNKKEVLDFIKYMVSYKTQKRLEEIPGFIPMNKQVFMESEKKYVIETRAILENLEIMPNSKEIKDFWEKSYLLLNRVFEGGEDVETAVKDTFREE